MCLQNRAWLSLVERLTGGQEVAGSNPVVLIAKTLVVRFSDGLKRGRNTLKIYWRASCVTMVVAA